MSVDLEKNKQKILEVYNDVLDDKTSTDWTLFGYEGQTNVLKVIESGDFGVEEMADDLNASKIMYGVVRVTDPKTSRTKIILINWQGESAPNLRKGVCARHLPDVKRMLKGVHITVTARTEDDLDSTIIMDALAKATSTEYNFSDRSELPDKNVPVGTCYKRTNPQKEINVNNRNKFWEEQEAEEKVRKELEIEKREQDAKKLEKERLEREIRDCKHRDELNKERNSRIVAEKRAESVVYGRISKCKEKEEWDKEVEKQHTEEIERARRADHMRMERKKEAESLIGQRTHVSRSMFESQSTPSSQKDSRSKPPNKLKDFNPSNTEYASKTKENLAPRRSVGARWPPPSNEEPYLKSSHSSEPKEIIKRKSLDAMKTQPHTSQEKVSANPVEKVVPDKLATMEHQSPNVSHISPATTRLISNSQSLQHNDDWSPQKMTSPSPAHPQIGKYSSHRDPFISGRETTTQAIILPRDTYPREKEASSPNDQSSSISVQPSFLHNQPSSSINQPSSSLNQPVSILKQTSSPHNKTSTTLNQPSSPHKQLSSPLPHHSPRKVSSPHKESSRPMETHFDNEPANQLSPSSSDTVNGHEKSYGEKYDQQYSNGDDHEHATSIHYDSAINREDLESYSMMYEVDGIEYQILPEHGLCARALYDYQAADETEITFDPGDIITNIEQIDVGWWQGVSSSGIFGLFPANYVELINGNGTKDQ